MMQTNGTVPGTGGQNATIVIPTDGPEADINIRVDGKGVHVLQGTRETTIPIHDVVPRGAVQIAWAVPATFALLLVGWPISRALARWIDRRSQLSRSTERLSQQFEERFAAMERNIDTVAIEVEKLSEAQRFTTKLLSERGEHVTTPLQPN